MKINQSSNISSTHFFSLHTWLLHLSHTSLPASISSTLSHTTLELRRVRPAHAAKEKLSDELPIMCTADRKKKCVRLERVHAIVKRLEIIDAKPLTSHCSEPYLPNDQHSAFFVSCGESSKAGEGGPY